MAKNTKTPDSQQDTPQAAKSIPAQPGQSSNNIASSTSTEIRAKRKPQKPSVSNLTWHIDGNDRNKQEVKYWICNTLSFNSMSLKALLEKYPGSPKRQLIYDWLKADDKFHDSYARVRVSMADYMAEEILDISDNATNDYMESLDKQGKGDAGYKFMGEHVQRSKLRIDSRKWLMAKMMPTKYGDKLLVEHKDAPLAEKTMEELENMARKLLNQRVVSEQ